MNRFVGFFVALACVACGPNPEGTWKTGCLEKTGSTKLTYEKEITISSDKWSANTVTYYDANCSSSWYTTTLKETGTYKLGETGKKNADKEEIDFTYDTVTLETNSATIATILSEYDNCGITIWQSGTAYDVAGKTCLTDKTASKGQVVYTTFQVQNPNKSDAKISFGKASSTADGTSAEKRMTELDTTEVFAD